MIFRIRKTNNYTVICNHVFRNNRLSWKAKGILAEMLSMPDDWQFSTQELIRRAKDGRDAVYSAIKELEGAGYLKRERATNEKGQFIGYDYNVYETPSLTKEQVVETEPCEEFPETENPPVTPIPYTENPTLPSTNNSVSPNGDTTLIENNPPILESEEVIATPYNPPVKERRFRKPTLEEVQEYCTQRGNRIDPQHFIDYYESNGWRVGRNPMKDWKAAVRTWESKDKQSNQSQYGNRQHSQDSRAGHGDTRSGGTERKPNYDGFYKF